MLKDNILVEISTEEHYRNKNVFCNYKNSMLILELKLQISKVNYVTFDTV